MPPDRLATVRRATTAPDDRYIDLDATGRVATARNPWPQTDFNPNPDAGCGYGWDYALAADSPQQRALAALLMWLRSLRASSAVWSPEPRTFVLLESHRADHVLLPIGTAVYVGPGDAELWFPAAASVGGIALPAGARAGVGEVGGDAVIVTVSSREPFDVGGLCVGAHTPNIFGSSGRLESFVLACDLEYGDHSVPAGTRALLNPDGTLSVVLLPRAGSFGPYEVPAEQWVCLAPNGTVTSVPLGAPYTANGVTFPRGTRLVLRSDGTFESARLTEVMCARRP